MQLYSCWIGAIWQNCNSSLSNKDQLKLIRPLTGILSLVGLTIKGDKEVSEQRRCPKNCLCIQPCGIVQMNQHRALSVIMSSVMLVSMRTNKLTLQDNR